MKNRGVTRMALPTDRKQDREQMDSNFACRSSVGLIVSLLPDKLRITPPQT